ncbi:hypothetical protein ABZP36_034381 [Zizania latifolia]
MSYHPIGLRKLRRLGGMTTSRRLADRKSAKFQKNITKRGSVPETTVKKGSDYPVGPMEQEQHLWFLQPRLLGQ